MVYNVTLILEEGMSVGLEKQSLVFIACPASNMYPVSEILGC